MRWDTQDQIRIRDSFKGSEECGIEPGHLILIPGKLNTQEVGRGKGRDLGLEELLWFLLPPLLSSPFSVPSLLHMILSPHPTPHMLSGRGTPQVHQSSWFRGNLVTRTRVWWVQAR